MEDRRRAISVRVGNQNFLTEDVQWFWRARLSRSECKRIQIGTVRCHYLLLPLLVVGLI